MAELPRKYVIVGNGFAGTSCAERLRALDQNAKILLFGNERYPLYNRLSLPPLLRRQIASSKVIMRNRAWHEERGIELHLDEQVRAINAQEKTVLTDTGDYPYDALLLATGGRASTRMIEGDREHGTYRFQTLDDAETLSTALQTCKCAVAVGGSFIAYELAEAFAVRGMQCHWIVRGPRVFHRFLDEEASSLVAAAAKDEGVELRCGRKCIEVKQDGGRTIIGFDDEQKISTDIVGLGLGLKINTELAAGTRIEVNDGFLCDDQLRTAEPGIFAAGDCAEFSDLALGVRYRMGTWNSAGAQGRLVAANMTGAAKSFDAIPEYSSQIFSTQKILQFGLSSEICTDLKKVSHFDPAARTYRALYFREDRMVGGVMIGQQNQGGRNKYLQAIRSNIRFNSAEKNAALAWRA